MTLTIGPRVLLLPIRASQEPLPTAECIRAAQSASPAQPLIIR